MSTLKEKAQEILDEKNLKIIPENVRDGVEIFDVVGEYQGSGDVVVITDDMSFAESRFSTLPSALANADYSQKSQFEHLFYNCTSLRNIPLLDTSNGTGMHEMFAGCNNLSSVPLLNTSNVDRTDYMFAACSSLVDVPILDLSNVNYITRMFADCSSLSNESLNNILYMCANATAYINQGTNMTLAEIGLSQAQAQICTTLSNWSACQGVGWITGYEE